MSDDQDPAEHDGEDSTGSTVTAGFLRYVRNIVKIEGTVDRLIKNQSKQQKLLDNLRDRVNRIEGQQEIIIRLLERERKD